MKDSLSTLFLISVVYIVSFSLTFGFVFPLQQILLDGVSAQIGLLFLPHGVRVLTIYFYGWRGILYLLPASYLMYILSAGQTGQSLLAPIVSLAGCYFGIQLIRMLLADTTSVSFIRHNWKIMFLGGVAASFFNGLGLSALDQILRSGIVNMAELKSVFGYVIGDVLGLMVCFAFVVYLFRAIRNLKYIPDN